jgi:hypothetical protein
MSIYTTPLYWDCECLEDYIHPKKENNCIYCGAEADFQPESRVNEVIDHLKTKGDEEEYSDFINTLCYNKDLDPELQLEMEEYIASTLFNDYELTEEEAKEASRTFLKRFLLEFRPDLFQINEETTNG